MWFFWLQSPVKFREKIRKLLPHFARPCDLFWLQSPAKLRAKIRELCLTSLGHVLYFGSHLRSNSEHKFGSSGIALESLNLEPKLESSPSLRSGMWFIMSAISVHINNKNSRCRPRFARPFGLFCLQYPVNLRAKN